MWATGRYIFGLSEEEFWDMSPGMWVALHDARYSELKVFDAFQARISSMIASSIPTKRKRRIKEKDFRLFPDAPRLRAKPNLLNKMRLMAAVTGIEVKRE